MEVQHLGLQQNNGIVKRQEKLLVSFNVILTTKQPIIKPSRNFRTGLVFRCPHCGKHMTEFSHSTRKGSAWTAKDRPGP